MKAMTFILLGVMGAFGLQADCGVSGGLKVFPERLYIRSNSIFVIEGSGYEGRSIVRNLEMKNPAYLQGRGTKIRLKVLQIIEGQFGLTQAVVKPEQDLMPGLKYSIGLDSLKSYPAFMRWNEAMKLSELVSYIATKDVDTLKPLISGQPKFNKNEYTPFGCGPDVFAIFSLGVKDSSAYLVKTMVKDIKTGETHTFYLESVIGKVSVGHDMCSGAFRFVKGRNYEVQFSVMDASGNVTACKGHPIRFKSPMLD